MALNHRKGFVYTLEAILASTLVLGVVLTVIPGFQQDVNTQPQGQVRSGLETLESTGDLTDNMSSEEIENEIDPYVPNSFNHSVAIVTVDSRSSSVSSPDEDYINTTGSYSEIQFWIESSSGLDVSFDNETVLEDYSGNGYKTVPVSNPEGWLNFTGTGELEYKFDSYSSDIEEIDEDQVSVVNYIVMANGTREVQVRLWK